MAKIGPPTKEIKKDKFVQIRVTETEYLKIRELAKLNNTTVTKLILQKLLS